MDTQDSLLVTAVRELTTEIRRWRRWRFLFGVLPLVAVFVGVLILASPDAVIKGAGSHTAQVDIVGIILPQAPASAEFVNYALQQAFEQEGVEGIVLYINSPGGSPVQADRIHTEIGRLRALYPDKPLYAVVDDVCASAAYYIASAADEIYVNSASLVGSIGVLSSSFGFVEALKELGIERRLIVSAPNKGMMDPFLPLEKSVRAHIQSLVDELHQQFVQVVKSSRGVRLVAPDEEVFDGRIWAGARAQEMGLVDGMGDVSQVARDKIGAEEVVNYTYEPGVLEHLADRVASQLSWIVEAWVRTPARL